MRKPVNGASEKMSVAKRRAVEGVSGVGVASERVFVCDLKRAPSDQRKQIRKHSSDTA